MGQYVFGLELKLVKRKQWRNPKELELKDNAPKIIPGRKLGPENAKVEYAQDNVEGGGIGAKLVDMDDDLAQELCEACSAGDDFVNDNKHWFRSKHGWSIQVVQIAKTPTSACLVLCLMAT